MTLRTSHKLKKVFVRLGPGEAFFRRLGSSVYFTIPGDDKYLGLGLPSDYDLDMIRPRPGVPPGWRVVK